MQKNNCEYEQRFVKELAAKKQNTELSEHVRQCGNCREALKVANWMQAFAETSPPAALPKPDFILWKAQIVEKRAKAERAVRPLVWAQAAAGVLIISIAAWMILNNQSQIEPTINALISSLSLIAAPLLICVACAAIICFMFVYDWGKPSKRK